MPPLIFSLNVKSTNNVRNVSPQRDAQTCALQPCPLASGTSITTCFKPAASPPTPTQLTEPGSSGDLVPRKGRGVVLNTAGWDLPHSIFSKAFRTVSFFFLPQLKVQLFPCNKSWTACTPNFLIEVEGKLHLPSSGCAQYIKSQNNDPVGHGRASERMSTLRLSLASRSQPIILI